VSLARAWPLAAVGAGGAIAAAALWTRRRAVAPASELAPVGTWVFPVPVVGDRWPVISDGWGSKRGSDLHKGADIMYRRRHRGELVDEYPPGTPSGSLWHFMPDGVPALAAAAGTIAFAGNTRRGYSVVLRHADGWVTYYTHLSALFVAESNGWTLGGGPSVAAGQPLGVIGYDPTDSNKLRHLHFELWRGTRARAVDPGPFLLAWSHVRRAPVADGLARVEVLPATARPRGARNRGCLTFRPVGARFEPYPGWVQKLRGKSGVYVIREIDGPILYVGESHTDRLHETLTRHFQTWRRFKGWWQGQYGEGHDPGLTYERGAVEAAVRITSPNEAIDEEQRLITQLCPRDNLRGQCDEEAPF
jgi:hypothetical protein